ncbi:uncharacterized protein LOC142163060 [Nicotiana tabacum]|uniref:Uncharacterized protein LOC142163060 n=1 Tax=Nicotiana tabacum TaxID=4097 RepID=A0AC58RUK5_TOBAC
MKDDESIQDMHTHFTSIINELHSLGEIIPRNKLVRIILSVLPSSWESKVNVITEAKDLQKLIIDELVDLKKTIECVRKEKEILTERVANIEHERDDLLVVVVDLKEILGELKMESRPENPQKGKVVASEAHIKLESELNLVKSSLCVELEKNKQIQEELGRVKSDLEKSRKWTCSSNAITVIFQSQQKNKVFAEKVTTGREPGPSYKKRMMSAWIRRSLIHPFPHYKGPNWALQGGSVSFGNGKKGYILEVGRIGKSLSHSIENVYYVKGLKYNLLSVSHICDKGNKVEFVSKICTFTNLVTGEVVLVAKRYKNIYVADFESLQNGDLSYLSDVDDDAELWHWRLGHASFTLLHKLVRKELIRGMPKSSFKDHKVCDACVTGKQVRSLFKPKKEVSTSRLLDLLHMDLCGPIRVPNR